jgi:hypothetical protein
MTARDFCFWLQGHFELNEGQPVTAEQAKIIRQHLALVFKHEIDPSMGGAVHQEALNEVHKPSQIGGTGPGSVVYRC